ncbi:MAG TPA: PAS domain-containing protein [Rhodanobacter sp.]
MKTGFLDGGGTMGALLRAHPWAQSLPGPVEQWPDSLRTVVSLMLNAPLPMFLLWGESRVCMYNDGYIPMLGARHPAALGAPFARVWPEVWDEIGPLIDRAYAGDSTYFDNFPLLLERSGFPEQAYFTFSYSPLRGPDGAVRGMFCICSETTSQLHAEMALRDSESKWRSLFENMQEGFFVAQAVRDAQGQIVDFRFTEVNPAFEVQSGLPSSIAPGRTILELLPRVPESLIQTYAQVVESGKPCRFEVDLGAANGRWYEVRARAVGEDDRVAVLFVDITGRKRTEEALRRSEAQFRGLAQAMPNQAWTARSDGTLDWFNDRVRDYAGLGSEQLAGDNWGSIVHPEDLPVAAAAWQQAVTSGTPYQAEFRLRRRDGVFRWHIARAMPIRADDGSIERWVGTNTDIEDQKRATELLELRIAQRSRELEKINEELRQSQKMEAVGQLTGGIAHDFNNLLTGVIGGLEMMQARLAQGRHQDADRCAELVMHSAQRAASLTHRLLAFSRRQPLEPRVVCVNELIGSMSELIERTLGPSIRLEIATDRNVWRTRCDLNQLESTLLNLVINARDAMPEGGVLTLATSNRVIGTGDRPLHDATAGEYVSLSVRDTGTGMTADTRRHAFEPFFTTKQPGQGTGLGLSMVYGFARQSGGFVELESEPGAGTTVQVCLPRSVEPLDTSPKPNLYPAAGQQTTPRTIVVVDDEAQVRELVVAVLQDLGHNCLEALDGPGALLQLTAAPLREIDLLITDVGLPGLDGRQLAARAREVRPGLKVLFITGYAHDAIFDGDADSGMELLSKPFTMIELANRVQHLLRTS